MTRIGSRVLLLLAISIALGCSDEPTSPAQKQMSLKGAMFDLQPFSAILGTSEFDPAATATAPTYVDPIILALEIRRTISMASDPQGQYSIYTGELDGAGIWVDGVYQQCFANVIFRWADAANNVYQSGPAPCSRNPNPVTLWQDTLLVKGPGQIFRRGGVPYHQSACNSSPCHSYGGSQTVVATPVPVPIGLRVNSPYIASTGTFATFTAVGAPDTLGTARRYKVPVRVVNWTWTAAGGGAGQTVPCNAGINPCQTNVREAGTMTVTAFVNGVQQTASVTMQVVPCPAGDSLIDNPVARAMGTATWQAMNTTGPAELRMERGAYMFDSSGTYVYRLSPINPVDDACRNANIPAAPFPGRPVVSIHGHGFGKTANGQDVELAPPCAWPPNLGPNQVAKYRSGPSGADWRRSLSDSLPVMVLDKDSVYRIYPHPIDSIAAPNGNWRYFPKDGFESKHKSAPRVSGSCVRM